MREGGIGQGAAGGKLAVVECFIILPGGIIDKIGLGIEGLDDNLAGSGAASGATGDLHQFGEKFFTGAEVGHIHPDIGHEDPDQRDAGEVDSFRDHLCPEEEVVLTGGEIGEDQVGAVAFGGGVGVETDHAGGREEAGEVLFDFLGAGSDIEEIGAAAFFAGFMIGFDEAAEMAHQFVAGAMVGEVQLAVGAKRSMAAVGAFDAGGEAATVEVEDDLMFIVQGFVDFGNEGGSEKDMVGIGAFFFEIDQADDGKADVFGTVHQFEESVSSRLGVVGPIRARGRRSRG